MAFSDRVATTTKTALAPKLVDTVLNSNVLTSMVLNKPKKWSGNQMLFPIKYQNGVSGGSFAGTDTFDTTASNRRVNLTFNAKFYEKSVVLPFTEVDANNTEDGVLDLVGTEFAMAAQEMADELGTVFYSDGTGNSSKDFLGLKAIDDDGTDAGTYGSLSRTTYTTLKSTVTASSGTLTLAKMATLYNAVSSGQQKPNLAVCPEAVFSFYEQLLQPMERIQQVTTPSKGKGMMGEAGFTSLMYKGVPVIADEKATAETLFFLNMDFIDFYALPSKNYEAIPYGKSSEVVGNDYDGLKGYGFSWSGWVRPTNAYMGIGHIVLGGELLSANPKRHGKLTGITGV